MPITLPSSSEPVSPAGVLKFAERSQRPPQTGMDIRMPTGPIVRSRAGGHAATRRRRSENRGGVGPFRRHGIALGWAHPPNRLGESGPGRPQCTPTRRSQAAATADQPPIESASRFGSPTRSSALSTIDKGRGEYMIVKWSDRSCSQPSYRVMSAASRTRPSGSRSASGDRAPRSCCSGTGCGPTARCGRSWLVGCIPVNSASRRCDSSRAARS